MKKFLICFLAALICAGALRPTLSAATSSAGTTGQALDRAQATFDLNTVTFDELQDIPGIGPVLAERILDRRARIGSFTRIDELLDVKGVGMKNLERFRRYLTLSPPPPPAANTSSAP